MKQAMEAACKAASAAAEAGAVAAKNFQVEIALPAIEASLAALIAAQAASEDDLESYAKAKRAYSACHQIAAEQMDILEGSRKSGGMVN
jgi:hypothetical protein